MASLVANGIDGVLRKHAANKQGGHKPWWLGPMAWLWLCNIGALILLEEGFGVSYTIIILRSPKMVRGIL